MKAVAISAVFYLLMVSGIRASPDGPTTTIPTPAIFETKVIHYTPAMPSSVGEDIKSGYCWTSSLSAPREGAWRCMVNNEIFDPCFSVGSGEFVLCGADPSIGNQGFLVKLTKPLPTAEVASGKSNNGWMIQLADGSFWRFMTGATLAVDGKRANYSSSEEAVYIIGDLKPGKVWVAEKATIGEKDSGFFIIKSEMVPLRTVWQ